MPVKGTYLAIAGGGIILLWSGLAGKRWSDVLRSIIAGKDPSKLTSATGISGTNFASEVPGASNPPNPAEVGSYKAFTMTLLASYGWAGQFAAANNIIMAESGWNPRIKNVSSGALGIAQALGHGTANTAGSLGNEYGNFGLSDAANKAANSGNGYQQLRWFFSYVKATYGSMNAAWAHHQSVGTY